MSYLAYVVVDGAFCRRLGIEPTDLDVASNAAFDNPQVERVLKVLQGRIQHAAGSVSVITGGRDSVASLALDDAAAILRTVLA